MHVLGTAGHVDHGKSSLVRALTGTDPDRWLEERLRGMTLDLGFAHLRFDDGVEAGIVDVPGHERFLHNMLAGAAGMELLLLVIDANEGPRRQTFEHLAILGYLNVRRTLVVATKIDLVPSAERPVVLTSIRDALRHTIAEDAPLLAVSTLTGEGLEALRAAIHAALTELASRPDDAPAYLPIDRVFSLPGLGTIVTGTLMQGRLGVGDHVRLTPLDREVRVRSLQVFGASRESVAAGARVAANLHGVDVGEIERGAVLASRHLPARAVFDVTFTALPEALGLLRRKTPVRAYVGAAEILGTLVFERVPDSVEPVAAILRLRAPTVAVPGSTFVVRRLSPKVVLGGGTIGAPSLDLEATGETDPDTERVAVALRDAGLAGADAERAGAVANVRPEVAQASLEALRASGRAFALLKPEGFVDAHVAGEFFAHLEATFEESERERPWLLGLTSLALARKLGVAETTLVRLLFAFADDGRLANRSGYFATAGFIPKLSPEQQTFFETELRVAPDAPNVPVPFEPLAAKMRASRIEGISQALDTLLASRAVARVGDDVYRDEQLARIRASLEGALRAKGRITPAEFRDLTGTSRKYAVPLLEWFDAQGVTLRSGDARVLRGARPGGV